MSEKLSEVVPVRFSEAMITAAGSLAAAENMTVSAWIRREIEREVSRRNGRCASCGQAVTA